MRSRDSHLQPDVLRACLKSPLFEHTPDIQPKIIKSTREALRRSIPSSALEGVWIGVRPGQLTKQIRTEAPDHLTVSTFIAIKRKTAHLVKVPIDKAPGELLFC